MEIEENVYEKSNRDLLDIINEFDKRSANRIGEEEEEDDEDEPLYKKIKTSNLSFEKGQSQAVIDEIRVMPLPREDGYIDTPYEAQMAAYRPFSKEYLAQEVERLRILEKNPDYRWATYMSGAQNKQVYQIYDKDDLQRVILERRRAEQMMHEEIKRTVVPLKEKNRQLIVLKEEQTTLVREQTLLDSYDDQKVVANRGKILIDGGKVRDGAKESQIVGFMELEKIILSLREIPNKKPNPEMGIDFNPQYIEDQLEGDSERDEILSGVGNDVFLQMMGNDLDLVDFLVLKVIWIRNYILDASSLKNILSLSLRDSPALEGLTDGFNNFIEPLESKTTIRGTEIWSKLLGSEVVILNWLSSLYTDELIIGMIRRGIAHYRTHWGIKPDKTYIYQTEMIDYLINNKSYNGTRKLLKEQPKEIERILLRVMTLEPFSSDRLGREREQLFKAILRSHFVWKYFYETDKIRLAYDWFINIKTIDVAQKMSYFYEILEDLENRYKAFIDVYYWDYIIPLLNDVTLYNTLTRKKIFNIPPLIKPLLGEKGKVKKEKEEDEKDGIFDLLNSIDYKPDDISRLIVDETFRHFFQTGELVLSGEEQARKKRKFPELVTYIPSESYRKLSGQIITLFPALILHFLYQTYLKFIELYKLEKASRLRSVLTSIERVNEKISEIAGETGPLDGGRQVRFRGDHPEYTQRRQFVNQVMNSGVIRLESTIVTFMNIAWQRIQDFCPGLRKLPLKQYQADHANDSGLESDFANLVASMIANQNLIYPSTYKSDSQSNTTIRFKGISYQYLKLYRFSFDESTGIYNSWRVLPSLTNNRHNRQNLGVLY